MKEIRFKLVNEKTDTEGKAPIYLFFNYSTYQFRYFTKEKVKAKDWDAAKMRFKRSYPGFQQANEYLDILEEKLRKAYRDYMNQGIVPTPSLLKSELLPEITVNSDAQQSETTSMVALFEEFIQNQISKGIKHGTKKSYTTNLSRLKRYVLASGKPLYVDRYTNSVHQNVVRTLIDLYNLQPNSIMDFCKQMKVFFNYCRSDKHITLHQYHADIKSGFVQTDRIYLTENDLDKLHNVVLTDSMVRVRDARFAAAISVRLLYGPALF